MTTEQEKKFFETFGIEPIAEYCKHQCNNELDESACIGCKYIEKVEYPQITDKQYLELICLLTKSKAMLPIICSENTQDLKDEILWDLIKAYTQFKKEIKHQVQAIFGSNQ